MKLRFLAAAAPDAALRALERRIAAGPSLENAFRSTALAVWVQPETPLVALDSGNGIAVGLLFDRASGARLDRIGCPGHPDGFPETAWGPAVLLVGSPEGHSVWRDPSGAIPVYYGSQAGLDLYASDAALLGAAWGDPFRPDLGFIRHWLTWPFLRAARTGADGILELVPGTRRVVTQGAATVSAYWSPYPFTTPDASVATFAAAAALVRREVLRTVAALGGAAGDVTLHLSGGLDSSILAAALCAAGLPFRPLTFATQAPDGDERRYARLMAKAAGTDLVELLDSGSSPGLEPPAPNSFRPPASPLLQPLHRSLDLQLALLGAGFVLDGAGGDNVFCSLSTASPAIDALRAKGAAAAWRTLQDVASLHGCTLWTAARSALRRLRRGPAARWPRDDRFLAEGAAAETREPHPWLDCPGGLPAGKADHRRLLVGIHHFLADPSPGRPATFRPLLAQPVLEACLRIPSWLWVEGGRDRAVARQAFRGLVPDPILDRRSKGSLESMLVRGYRTLRPALEPFLLDGLLVRNGIVDGASISSYLRQDGEPKDSLYIRLLEIAAAEQWLRSFG